MISLAAQAAAVCVGTPNLNKSAKVLDNTLLVVRLFHGKSLRRTSLSANNSSGKSRICQLWRSDDLRDQEFTP
jgi:hypothetical protein